MGLGAAPTGSAGGGKGAGRGGGAAGAWKGEEGDQWTGHQAQLDHPRWRWPGLPQEATWLGTQLGRLPPSPPGPEGASKRGSDVVGEGMTGGGRDWQEEGVERWRSLLLPFPPSLVPLDLNLRVRRSFALRALRAACAPPASHHLWEVISHSIITGVIQVIKTD